MNFLQTFKKAMVSLYRLVSLEGLIWISALIYLAFFNNPAEAHFTICPLSNLGFEYCPGCGLGSSISKLFRGEFSQSFGTHLLAIPALLIILYRIFSLIKSNYNKYQINLSIKGENYA